MTVIKPASADPGDGTAHLVVWVDHRSARIYALTRGAVHETAVRNSETGRGRIHHHAGAVGSGHVTLSAAFLGSVSVAIGTARNILIIGPGDAKTLLKSYLDRRKPLQAAKVLAVEPLDRVGDGEILTYARRFFARTDRIPPSPHKE